MPVTMFDSRPLPFLQLVRVLCTVETLAIKHVKKIEQSFFKTTQDQQGLGKCDTGYTSGAPINGGYASCDSGLSVRKPHMIASQPFFEVVPNNLDVRCTFHPAALNAGAG